MFLSYVVVFWGIGCADELVLFPSRQSIPSFEAKRNILDTEMGRIETFSLLSRRALEEGGPRAIVLETIPNAGRAEYAWSGAERWANWPVEYVSINYPGYGQSEGSATLANVHRSALAAFDAVAARAEGKPIYVSGASLGTTAALHIAANRPVAGVMLQNPVPLRQLILGHHGWWNLWIVALPVAMHVPQELDAIANAKRVQAPAVFIMAENDELVTPEYQHRVAAAYAGEKREIHYPGGHDAEPSGESKDALQAGQEWLWQKHFGSSTPSPD
ncbi:MAG TPA: hypothetical protein VGB55_12700 [Tepidisphaeraceae bacterium]